MLVQSKVSTYLTSLAVISRYCVIIFETSLEIYLLNLSATFYLPVCSIQIPED